MCGGEDDQGVIYSECFYYSVSDKIWLFLQELEVGRSFAAVETLDGCLYVGGGKTSEGAESSVEVVGGDGCEDEGVVEELAVGVYGHCMVEVGGELVVVGGSPDSYGSTWVYNIVEKVWRNTSSPQKDRASHGCTKVIIEQEEAVLVAGNDFSPQDLAEVKNDTKLDFFRFFS